MQCSVYWTHKMKTVQTNNNKILPCPGYRVIWNSSNRGSKQLLTSANSISHRQDVGGLHLDLVGVADDGGELYHEQYDEHGVKIEVRQY